MASLTVVIFSAASSGISTPNSSSKAITSSTMSRLSAPRSSMKLASGVTLSSSTPRCSTTIFLTRSGVSVISCPLEAGLGFPVALMNAAQAGKGSGETVAPPPKRRYDSRETERGAVRVGSFGPLIVGALALVLAACGDGDRTAETPTGVAEFTTIDFANVANYSAPKLPAYFDQTVAALDNSPASNAASDRVATLGRVLFYDL